MYRIGGQTSDASSSECLTLIPMLLQPNAEFRLVWCSGSVLVVDQSASCSPRSCFSLSLFGVVVGGVSRGSRAVHGCRSDVSDHHVGIFELGNQGRRAVGRSTLAPPSCLNYDSRWQALAFCRYRPSASPDNTALSCIPDHRHYSILALVNDTIISMSANRNIKFW